MPRTARKVSGSGVYHIVLRGINKQTIFYDDEDREVFLNRIKLIKTEMPYEVYGFCIMSNHIHLLIKEHKTPIGRIMQKILCSYVHWYNRKYERIGNLFQDRYKSEPIEKDSHLLSCLRYIHQNPVKAGMEKEVGEYEWSSHEVYAEGKQSFVDTELLLDMLEGTEGYKAFVSKLEPMEFGEFENKIALSDNKLKENVEQICRKHGIANILEIGKEVRNEVLLMLRQIPGASIRQISRVTGVPIMMVRRSD